MSPRTGRPTTDPKNQGKVEVRLSVEEKEKLEYCCQQTGRTKSEIIREGIEIVYRNLMEASANKKD